MTPYEFGCRVKRAVEETGGLGEYLGQGFDNGVKRFNKAVGMPELSPQAWGGGGAMPVPVPAPATPTASNLPPMTGPSTPMPESWRTPQRPPVYRPMSPMTGPSVVTPAPVKPSPRPAAVKPAPVQPKPTAPGARKPGGRVA